VEIAVVIPALDEASQVTSAIRSAQVPDQNVQILVVDGGSQDDTADRARSAGAEVLRGERGRARQLDVGWRSTKAEVVLFLHADTKLPECWLPAVRAALADSRVAGGAFGLRFDELDGLLRLIGWGAALRARLLELPYGDQAIFVRRTVLERVGGIPDVAVMEDLDLVSAIKAEGRLALLPLQVVTSSRRYRGQGVLRTAVRHVLALAAWRLGVDRQWLAGWLQR
jgi:rSAM/selenodomain-associated transferase 2